VIAVLLVVVGPTTTNSTANGRDRADHYQQHCYHQAPTVKPEAATAVELLMMDMRMPETCSAVFKQQVINLRSFCILLADSVESLSVIDTQGGYRIFLFF